jgi:hypothetical protein
VIQIPEITSVNDTRDLKVSQPDISLIPTDWKTEKRLIHALLICAANRKVVDVYMTPSYQEMEKLIGSSFWIPFRDDRLAGDCLFCDEGQFMGYEDFVVLGRPVTGSALVVGVDRDRHLDDCSMELADLLKMVEWNNAKKRPKS